MIRFLAQTLKWVVASGVSLWFILIALLPFYGLLRPWPEATAAIRDSGVSGLLLMIGAGTDKESDGVDWHSREQRTYIAVPDSITTGNIFIYTTIRSITITGEQDTLVVEPLFVLFLLLWAGAGFVFWKLITKITKRANKALHPTATRVTPPASSLRSGQESRHG